MHVIAIKNSVVEANPSFPRQLLTIFEQSKSISEAYLDAPGWSQLPWARLAREEQSSLIGLETWPIGFIKNKINIDRFIGYSFKQDLIDRRISATDLFHATVIDS